MALRAPTQLLIGTLLGVALALVAWNALGARLLPGKPAAPPPIAAPVQPPRPTKPTGKPRSFEMPRPLGVGPLPPSIPPDRQQVQPPTRK